MEEEKEIEKIEIRSEVVQEILNRPPKWVVSWGITVIFFVVAVIIVGSWFFKYPDVISAGVNLTTQNPPAPILAKATGKIQNLFVVDNEDTKRNQVIGVIENPASFESANKVKIYLENFKNEYELGEPIKMPEKFFNLGTIQPYYASFFRNLEDYNKTIRLDYYNKKLKLQKNELEKYQLYLQNMKVQRGIQYEEYLLMKKQFDRDSIIYNSKEDFMSDAEFERSKSNLLSKQYGYEQTKVAVNNAEIQIESINQNVLELELQQEKQYADLNLMIWESFENLYSSIDSWEYQYVLKSPTNGLITFNKFWNENQSVKAGETVFTIIPDVEGEIVGKVKLSFTGAGKVKIGQRVNIKFAGYPFMEFGMVKGEVRSVSLAPNDDSYTVEVSLPNGLKTFYGIELDFKQEMQGTAEIITEDIRLLERIIRPLRYVLKKNTSLGE